ncbi:hypothetical protein [Arenimonas oryziterrae]|uniref:Carboxypeptidase regulatory-like domain-containing protein n=1 Tax=Arenimonas oryziterrae DSM 21050 = YC6267 TaxID=1121015 RepID=A0A091AYP1_9GAMM|nr:hypothetical protein [Arenimonas oryziterrae]KFN43784.1 hypothetical protein N789_07515 [Arenimonas oryziterrae DSM 21050 = YC6267]
MRALVVLTLAILASACDRAPAASAAPSPPATPVAATPPPAPAPSEPSDDNDALSALVHCGDRSLLTQPPAAQLAKLGADPRLQCHAQDRKDRALVICQPTEPLSTYGGRRIFSFELASSASAQTLSMQVQGDRAGLVSDVAAASELALSKDAAGQDFLDLDGHGGERIEFADGAEANQSVLRCVVATAAAADASAPTPAPKPAPGGSGMISGHIEYPSEAIPPMHVCAISTDGAQAGCVRTTADQREYRIDRLAAGDYKVYAWFHEGDMRVMRASEMRWCIRAPCPPGPPVTITLKTGEHHDKAHLNEYGEEFPDMPAEPGDP